jgi:hypothetical protein
MSERILLGEAQCLGGLQRKAALASIGWRMTESQLNAIAFRAATPGNPPDWRSDVRDLIAEVRSLQGIKTRSDKMFGPGVLEEICDIRPNASHGIRGSLLVLLVASEVVAAALILWMLG